MSILLSNRVNLTTMSLCLNLVINTKQKLRHNQLILKVIKDKSIHMRLKAFLCSPKRPFKALDLD